jgi:5'-3' exonuclease
MRLMIIDALNAFLRNYVVDPSLSSTNGMPIGGLRGFLRSLQKLSRDINPDQIIVVWDGGGSSKKRKLINKNYKQGRKPVRINRAIRNLSDIEEEQGKIWQQVRLVEYMNQTPIVQLIHEDVEADDVIAYVSKMKTFSDWQKVIVSSDKDFFQLCDAKTVVYRPIRKEFVNVRKVLEDFKIHPNNFALARSIAGDKSDNLAGVGGIGLKTVAKRFPDFADEKCLLFEDLQQICENKKEEYKVYNDLLLSLDKAKENYSLMQLGSPQLSFQATYKIRTTLENFKPEFNQTEFQKMLIQDGFNDTNLSELFATFRKFVKNK